MLGSFVGPAAQHESDNQAIVHLLLLLLLLHGALNLKTSKSSKAFQVTHMSVLGQNFPISLLFCFSPPSSQHYGREGKVFLNSLKMKFHFVAILSLILILMLCLCKLIALNQHHHHHHHHHHLIIIIVIMNMCAGSWGRRMVSNTILLDSGLDAPPKLTYGRACDDDDDHHHHRG